MSSVLIFSCNLDLDMAESGLHRSMKQVVAIELEAEGFSVVEEPLYPPVRDLRWSYYRPDLLGFRMRDDGRDFVIVECETHPAMRRFMRKNFRSLSFKPRLFQRDTLKRVLAIPRGKLSAVDLALRGQWEVWVMGLGAREFETLQRIR